MRGLVRSDVRKRGADILSLSFAIRGCSVGMKRCTVSVIDGDSEPHQVAVNAASLFDALDQTMEQWSRLSRFGTSERARTEPGSRATRE